MSDNGNTPATKRDLAKLKAEIIEALHEDIHDSETRLLKAFYTYAEATQKHLVDLDKSDGSIRDRLGALEARLINVEKRLDLPSGS